MSKVFAKEYFFNLITKTERVLDSCISVGSKFHSLAVWGKKEFFNTTVRAKDILHLMNEK